MTTWTPQQHEQLVSLAAQGLSASQIGAELGYSRNAVVSRIHRTKVEWPHNWATGAPRKPRERKPRRRLQRVRTPMLLMPATGYVEPPVSNEAPASFERELIDLHSDECRWPTHTDEKWHHKFCGHPVVPGEPYCHFHLRRSQT